MELATFLGISLLPILSPGPSSILAIRNSLRHGLRFATIRLMADLAGTLLISSLLLSGLGALIINSQSLLVAIQMAGASYVLVIGMTCLWKVRLSTAPSLQGAYGAGNPWLESFLAGLLNPKTWVFFALASQPLLQNEATNQSDKFLYPLSYTLLKGIILWGVSWLFITARDRLNRCMLLANRLLGVSLIAASSLILLKISMSI